LIGGRAIVKAVKRTPRESWSILLVLLHLHLLVAPCATAMLMMPADMDCEHCQTSSNPDACVAASATAGATLGGLAFDASHFDPPVSRLTEALPDALPEPVATSAWSRACVTRHSSDPPLYLVLGQLRL
jgi:hypothetical protein